MNVNRINREATYQEKVEEEERAYYARLQDEELEDDYAPQADERLLRLYNLDEKRRLHS